MYIFIRVLSLFPTARKLYLLKNLSASKRKMLQDSSNRKMLQDSSEPETQRQRSDG